MGQLLLRNGTALLHGDDDHVRAAQVDILIDGNKIVKVDRDIQAPQAQVIDCTDKIISPGFIDTHHHVWQTQLKGRHSDQTLWQYLPGGNFIAKVYSSEDAFWGQLGGCLEMIDGGTTTVADYAHISVSPEHNYNAISATVASGLRSVYGFSPNARLESLVPFIIDPNGLGGHSMSTFDELAKQTPWGDGRVHLGLAWDGFPFTPKECTDMLMAKKPGQPSTPQHIEKLGYLDHRFLTSHPVPRGDGELYRKRGVHYSSTPSTEQQMSIAFPVTAFDKSLGIEDLGSFGVDCHSATSAYLPGEARIGLQGARAARGAIVAERGKTPRTIKHTEEDAFNLATIRGARAMKMGDSIGSIAEGKLADLVIFDSDSPSMICGAVHDPVAAIILHSSPADVDTVIVDGTIRKQHGKLVEVKLDDSIGKQVAGQASLTWPDVARSLIRTRERIQAKSEKIDMKQAEKTVLEMSIFRRAVLRIREEMFWPACPLSAQFQHEAINLISTI